MRSAEKIALRENTTKEKIEEKYGKDLLFYIDPVSNMGEQDAEICLDYNMRFPGVPSLWCDWKYEDGCIFWDGIMNFYSYQEWLQLIFDRVLTNDYLINGIILVKGEYENDYGRIVANGRSFIYENFGVATDHHELLFENEQYKNDNVMLYENCMEEECMRFKYDLQIDTASLLEEQRMKSAIFGTHDETTQSKCLKRNGSSDLQLPPKRSKSE
eukprot:TRINITY_DN866_c0_g1_i2.p1 TRINITY_DN866_c0_g1~~TRINITY_DN866_c0_g1_i2.p1  ORF type:complete len:214 (-),score=49.11 TRINITY_DN866_c0_g1_i2:121-762(-)